MNVTLTLNDYFPSRPQAFPLGFAPGTPALQPQPTAPVQNDLALFSEELLLDELLDAVDYLTFGLASNYGPTATSGCPCSAQAAPSITPPLSSAHPAPPASARNTRQTSTSPAAADDPASFYLTQNQSEYNPEGSINANCGPASLAMAALAFGKNPPGTSKDDPEGLIRAVRKQMTGNEDIHELTGDDDVTRGAQALGMSAQPANSVEAVNAALDAGQMVVAGGDPSAYSGGSGGHFVLITGRSADGGYVMNDPAYTGKPGVVLTAEKFAAFFGGGVAVGP